MTDLEVLYAARARLVEGAPFRFSDWTQCTCGHIYAAAVGHRDLYGAEIQDPGPSTTYGSAITAAARALGWTGPLHLDHDGDPLTAAEYVSWRTLLGSETQLEANVSRDDAVRVIEAAIGEIEKAEDQARLAVLEQTRTVVDAVVIETETVA